MLGDDHLAILAIERTAGVKFAVVHFDGSVQRDPALLGGKIDFSVGNVRSFYKMARQGDLEYISVLDKQDSPLAPGVPTAESLEMKIYSTKATGMYAPGGTPQEIVDVLSAAMKKATADPELQKEESDQGRFVRNMDPAEMAKYWDEVDIDVTPLMKQALEEDK